ncbi:MAG: S26 family signal peptidase [Pirellulaceae bacterium]
MPGDDSITRSVGDEPLALPAQPSSSGPNRSASSLSITQTVVAPAGDALVRLRWLVAGVLALLVVLTLVRLGMVEGLARTVRVAGPSMAPAFYGGHFRVVCEDCGFAFRCDGEHPPAIRQATCPNCGYLGNPLRDEYLVPGERVLLDRWPFAMRSPRVGEAVAARQPGEGAGLVVKRVAALPGERLAIDRGDLLADGRLVRKDLRELAQVRVLVYDNDYQPQRTSGLPDRWSSPAAQSGWQAAGTGFRHDAGGVGGLDWLEYHHWRMFGLHARTRPGPVLDLDSYNQAADRNLNVVPDVQLACVLRARGAGRFALAALDGGQRFEALFDLGARTVTLRANGKPVGHDELPPRFARRGAAIVFGLCDRRVLLGIGGQQVFAYEYERPAGHAPEVTRPLAVGVDRASLELTHLQVWRDLYYLAPDGTGDRWQADGPLPSGTFALLGDNTPVSIDSRQWTVAGGQSRILGRVYRPFWLTGGASRGL